MSQTIRYRGRSDVRIITDTQFTSIGLSSVTITWNKANGYEVDVSDPVAAYLLTQGEFEAGNPNTKFGDMLDLPVVTNFATGDTWSKYTQNLFTVDGAQVFTASVANRRGRFTGAATPGNHRTLAAHADTNWENSEILAVIYGPSTFTTSPVNRPQLGVFHRLNSSGGRSRAMVAWSNIFGGPNPEVFNLNLWETDGSALFQGAGGVGGGLGQTTREARIIRAERVDVFNVNQLNLAQPGGAFHAPNGIPGRVSGMTDTSFNCTTNPIASCSRTGGVVTCVTTGSHLMTTGDWGFFDTNEAGDTYDGPFQVTVINATTVTYLQPGVADDVSGGTGTLTKLFITGGNNPAQGLVTVGPDVAANNNIDNVAGGIWTPEYPWRCFPMIVRSKLVGNTLTFSQWGMGMAEVDEGAVIGVWQQTITTDGDTVALPSGRGLCGVVFAHAHDNSYGEYGTIIYKQLKS